MTDKEVSMSEEFKYAFWKTLDFMEKDADIPMEFRHWFEAMALNYVMDPVPVDELAACLDYYAMKEFI